MVCTEYVFFLIRILIIFIIVLDNPSPAFTKFLSLLGDEIVLKGWGKFRGGLDATGNYCFILFYF